MDISGMIWTSVEDYYHRVNGVDNDRQCIQNAINSGNLIYLLPDSTYFIDGSIEIGDGQCLYIPKSTTIKFNENSQSSSAIIMKTNGTLLGDGTIISTRYYYGNNRWNINDYKNAIQLMGSFAKVEVGSICGFECGVYAGGPYSVVSCNVSIRLLISVLECFILNPYGGGCVNNNYFQWDITSIGWHTEDIVHNPDHVFRPYSCGIEMLGEDELKHNTFRGSVEGYYIGLKLSGAFNRFLGFRAEGTDYTVVINNLYNVMFNSIFGEYGDYREKFHPIVGFYNKILNQQTSKSIEYAVQIYGPEGINKLNKLYYKSLSFLSDSSLKTSIQLIDDATNKILNLRGTTFRFKSEISDDNKISYGFIAQEVQTIVPDLVEKNDDSMLTVNYVGIIPIMVEAIKERQTKLIKQMNDIAKLKEQILMLEGLVNI